MATITSLLQRLKVESKKSVTSVSRNDGIEYQLENIELNGQTFSMKKVAILGDERYKVGWILDNQTTSCMRCTKGFSLLAWRHHCRSCGYVICQSCGDKKINFEVFVEEAPQGSRVCGCCYNARNLETNQNGKNGPRTLMSSTPESVQAPVTKAIVPAASLPAVTESSFDMNATLDTEATTIESSETSEITTNSAAVAPSLDHAEKFYVPKMRPSVAASHRPVSLTAAAEPSTAASLPAVRRGSGTGLGLDLPAPATLAVHHVPLANPAVAVSQPVLLDLSAAHAAPSLGMPQHDQCAPAPPARKSKEVPSTSVPSSAQPASAGMLTGSLQPISRTYDYSVREEEHSLSAHSLAALNSSIVSTATKTTINTALNAKLTAPPPRLGITCTAPEIFSPVHKKALSDPNTLDLSTPPSGGSCGSGEVVVDMSKFGSPVTRKLIMEDARCNVIWEADDDDASSTTCSSIAPTPSSGISGTTNGGAGVGYIRSPWDNTFSPFNSAQKPRRLMGSGNTSAGKSGRRRKFSTDQPCVRFAAEDAAFAASAMADIANEVESSPGLPLTREQLLFQQQYLRHQQMHLQNQQAQAAQAGRVPTKVDLQSQRDAENAHVNVMPVQDKNEKNSKAAKNVQNSAVHVASTTDATKMVVAAGLPALGKSGVNKATRAAPR